MYIAYYYLRSARWLPGKTCLFVPWLPSLEFYQPSSWIFHTEGGIPVIFISFTFFRLARSRNNIKQHRLFCSHKIRLAKTRGKRFSYVFATTSIHRLLFFFLTFRGDISVVFSVTNKMNEAFLIVATCILKSTQFTHQQMHYPLTWLKVYLQIIIYVTKVWVRLKKLYTLYWLQTTGFVITSLLKGIFYVYSKSLILLNF